MSGDTPIHESQMEAMWAQKEAEDLKRWTERNRVSGDPRVRAIQAFLSEYCQLKLKASWSGKVLYQAFDSYITKNPYQAFNFTNHQTGNVSCKSVLKKVCDQIFPYKNFKTKHYYIKTQEHIEIIKSQLNNEKLRI